MGVVEAFRAKESEVAGRLAWVIRCGRDLYYIATDNKPLGSPVYPVSSEQARAEATRLGVRLVEARG